MRFQTVGARFALLGEAFVPKIDMGPKPCMGLIYERVESAGSTKKFVAISHSYEAAVAVGEAFAKEELMRSELQGVHLLGGAKKSDGNWWLTYSVEGLD